MRQSLIFFVTILIVSCTNKIENLENFQLLPVVQEFKFNNGFSNLNFKNLKFAHSQSNDELPLRFDYTKHIKQNIKDESNLFYSIEPSSRLNKEGYKLNISKDKITIVAKDEPGLFYAFLTLNQMLEDSEKSQINLPLVTINDYPKLKFRPIHLDVKHHLEKKSYYFDLIDELAKLKINGIIVEFEDKLKYQSRPEVGSSDAMSIDWWGRLSDYAIERNVAISPLVQGLGHASYILKHEKNKFLRDKPESDWAFNPLLKETYDLQFDLYRDAIKATPHGKYLHVGGDEVHLTKRNGKSELELNLIWLNRVSEFAKENNRIPIFWDDMPLKHSGLYRPMFNSQMSVDEVDKIWTENDKNLQKFIDKLTGNAKYQGSFGEKFLEQSLQFHGFKLNVDYTKQKHEDVYNLENDTSEVTIPDIVLNIGDSTHIICDSKVSLDNWKKFVNAENDQEKNDQFKKHYFAVKKHIDDLSKKDYIKNLKKQVFQKVIMYMPHEAAYLGALEHDPELYEYAFKKNIILCGPKNLFAVISIAQTIRDKEKQIDSVKEMYSEKVNGSESSSVSE